ncbi:uncharacterized protein GLRG_01123 [Colletotrichum graminicola M1.001]|uniref:Uncharacterized protein n=1 Tax=Colletotrichum graminicola (strain M1.001 / M2 / FGSC 10212) TaxID=645133 RepID=E3Q5L2_COLGM|nr:uncharacterized protein GLRG_01123 [Colletotrichum graminicola M1.001]EFQ25979.1 hypothetical protein GLRG_01123 [Colletotrichum graminicola M1.001]
MFSTYRYGGFFRLSVFGFLFFSPDAFPGCRAAEPLRHVARRLSVRTPVDERLLRWGGRQGLLARDERHVLPRLPRPAELVRREGEQLHQHHGRSLERLAPGRSVRRESSGGSERVQGCHLLLVAPFHPRRNAFCFPSTSLPTGRGADEGALATDPTAGNFTYTVEGDNWRWVPTDVCNQTVVSCMWTVPRDFRGTGSYVVVAVREAAAALPAYTATSGPFTIVASGDPTASAAATGIGPPGSSGPSGSSKLPAETAVAPPAAADGRGISTGAAVGISCGAVVVLLGLAGLLWFLWRRRKGTLGAAAKARAPGRENGYEKPELDGRAVVAAREEAGVEIDRRPVHVVELDGQQTWDKEGVAAETHEAKSNVHVKSSSSAAELESG